MPETESRVERFLLPFATEPTLWPVLLAVIGHAVALLAPVMLFAVRDGRLSSWALLGLLALLTGSLVSHETRGTRRPRLFSAVVLATWALGAGVALVAHRYGIL